MLGLDCDMAQGLVGDRGPEWVDGREQGWVDGKGLVWEDGKGQLVGDRVLGLLVGGTVQVGDRVWEQGKLVPGGSLQ